MICEWCDKDKPPEKFDANGVCFPCNDFKDYMKDVKPVMPQVIQNEINRREFHESQHKRSIVRARR